MNTVNNKKKVQYKEKLKSGYLQLLEEGADIDRITVKAICEAAGVNRSTFYSHYALPGDILNDIEEETMDSISRYMRKIASEDLDYISEFLRYIREHDDVFRMLFLHAKDKQFIEEMIQQALLNSEHFSVYFKNGTDFRYAAKFIASGSREVINTWITGNYAEDEDYIRSLIVSVNESVIKALS